MTPPRLSLAITCYPVYLLNVACSKSVIEDFNSAGYIDPLEPTQGGSGWHRIGV